MNRLCRAAARTDSWARAIREDRWAPATAKRTKSGHVNCQLSIANRQFKSAIGNWKCEVVMSVDKDLVSVQQARDLVEAAHRAQAQVAEFDQAKIDRICEAMAKAALADSARLGVMAVEETGYGVADDKREKNRFAAEDVWNYFRACH